MFQACHRVELRIVGVLVLWVMYGPYPVPASADPAGGEVIPGGTSDPLSGTVHKEVPDDPPGTVPDRPPASLRDRQTTWTLGPYTSIQANVDADGNNIRGDAANEPSLAVDPSDPSRMVIGWRQFDTVTSNFRQAGWAYSHNGGHSWTFPGVLEPGQFSSDPVLAADRQGHFYFYSLQPDRDQIPWGCFLYKSFDGGLTWPQEEFAGGGDKEWMTIDTTTGMGSGNIYMTWNRAYSCCGDTDFTRSTTGGVSIMSPMAMPSALHWGTLSVGPDGELYVSGESFYVAKSTNAKNPSVTPTFDFVTTVNLGGTIGTGGPNPDGLLGQAWVATDHSSGPTRGYVYLLCSVNPPGSDPLDVMFSRSTNGGVSWSSPVRVNNVQTGWQWFGTMSVAPNGRIDAVWNDTRNYPAANYSELYYSYSVDAGSHWSANVPVSLPFNHSLGYPNQNKIGDYYHMISDDLGASVAYAATFNGEEDVYFLRIGTYDCNGNGISDLTDIAAGTSADCNTNSIPDECEPNEDCNLNGIKDICDIGFGTSADCTANGTPDECEPDCNNNGTADSCDAVTRDCNSNGIPDDCEAVVWDCNGNNIFDACDLSAGTSPDCNSNGTPDECDLAGGTSFDCTDNGILDECETDCNHNRVRDDCDLAGGTSFDCTGNGTPDECEIDCNANGIRDDCDLAAGTAQDCNLNGIPDECDIPRCYPLWNGFQGLAYQLPTNGLDIDGDGVPWSNPAGTAQIWVYGCEFEGTSDRSVQVTVTTTPPEDGYVVSEYFQSNGGILPPNEQVYSLSFRLRLEGYVNPKTDWQLTLYDALNAKAVCEIDFTSTVSTRVPTDQRGRILVKNPSGSPAFLSTGVAAAVGDCYDFKVVLDHLADTVQLDVDGVPRLNPPVAVLESGARRLDDFRLQAVSNGALNGGATALKLDAFQLCLTGGAAVPPALWDCNGNGVLDECDLSAGTSRDCNANGIPDDCEVGDFNGDGNVDLTDYATFINCITGPGGGPLVGTCVCADYDGDADVDVADFAAFQRAFTAP